MILYGRKIQDSASMQAAKDYIQGSEGLKECKIGPLDALYFYLYQCQVPTEFINSLALKVPGKSNVLLVYY